MKIEKFKSFNEMQIGDICTYMVAKMDKDATLDWIEVVNDSEKCLKLRIGLNSFIDEDGETSVDEYGIWISCSAVVIGEGRYVSNMRLIDMVMVDEILV